MSLRSILSAFMSLVHFWMCIYPSICFAQRGLRFEVLQERNENPLSHKNQTSLRVKAIKLENMGDKQGKTVFNEVIVFNHQNQKAQVPFQRAEKDKESFALKAVYGLNQASLSYWDPLTKAKVILRIDPSGKIIVHELNSQDTAIGVKTFDTLWVRKAINIKSPELFLHGNNIHNESRIDAKRIFLNADPIKGQITNAPEGEIITEELHTFHKKFRNQGRIYSEGNLLFDLHHNNFLNEDTGEDNFSKGKLMSYVKAPGNLILIHGKKITNNSLIEASHAYASCFIETQKLLNTHTIQSEHDTSIIARILQNNKRIFGAQKLHLLIKEKIENNGTFLSSYSQIMTKNLHNYGLIKALNNLRLTQLKGGKGFYNYEKGTISSEGQAVQTTDFFFNKKGGALKASDLQIIGREAHNEGEWKASKSLNITLDKLQHLEGKIQSDRQATVKIFQEWLNKAQVYIKERGNISVRNLNNENEILSDHFLKITILEKSLNKGTLHSKEILHLIVNNLLDNEGSLKTPEKDSALPLKFSQDQRIILEGPGKVSNYGQLTSEQGSLRINLGKELHNEGNISAHCIETFKVPRMNNQSLISSQKSKGTTLLETDHFINGEKAKFDIEGNLTFLLHQAAYNNNHFSVGGNLSLKEQGHFTNHKDFMIGKNISGDFGIITNSPKGMWKIGGEFETFSLSELRNFGSIQGQGYLKLKRGENQGAFVVSPALTLDIFEHFFHKPTGLFEVHKAFITAGEGKFEHEGFIKTPHLFANNAQYILSGSQGEGIQALTLGNRNDTFTVTQNSLLEIQKLRKEKEISSSLLAGDVILNGKMKIQKGILRRENLQVGPKGELILGKGQYGVHHIDNNGILELQEKTWLSAATASGEGVYQTDQDFSISIGLRNPKRQDLTGGRLTLTDKSLPELPNLKSQKNLSLQVAPTLNAGKFMSMYHQGWSAQMLFLKGGIFKPEEPIHFPIKSEIQVQHFRNEFDMAFRALKLQAKTFRHGKDNKYLPQLEILKGEENSSEEAPPLNIIVEEDLDSRYGRILSPEKIFLTSLEKDILIGAAVEVNDQTAHANGAFAKSDKTLILEAPKGVIKNHFGELDGKEKLIYKAKRVENLSALGVSEGDIFIDAEGFIHGIHPDMYWVYGGKEIYRYNTYVRVWKERYGPFGMFSRRHEVICYLPVYSDYHLGYYKAKKENGNPLTSLLLSTNGQIHLNTSGAGTVSGGSLLAADKILWTDVNKMLQEVVPSTIRLEDASLWKHRIEDNQRTVVGTVPSVVSGGTKVELKDLKGSLNVSGTLSAQEISILKASGINLLNPTNQKTSKGLKQKSLTLKPSSRRVSDTDAQRLRARMVGLKGKLPSSMSAVHPSEWEKRLGISLHNRIFTDMLMQKMAKTFNRVEYQGLSGNRLTQNLIKAGMEFARDHLFSITHSHQHSHIEQALERYVSPMLILVTEGAGTEARDVLKLYATPDMLIPNTGTSGNIHGSRKVEIKEIGQEGIKVEGGTVSSGTEGIHLKSEGDIKVASLKTGRCEGMSFVETLSAAGELISQGDIEGETQGNIHFKAAETSSETGTHLEAKKQIIDEAVPLTSVHYQNIDERKQKGSIVTAHTSQSVSKHTSKGKFEAEAQRQKLSAPDIKADEINLSAQQGVDLLDVKETSSCTANIAKAGGMFKSGKTLHEQSSNSRSKGAKLESNKPVKISTVTDDVTLTNVNIKAPRVILTSLEGMVRILLGINTSNLSRTENKSNLIWQSQTSRVDSHQTYSASEFSGPVEIHSRETLIEEIRGQTLSFLKNIDAKDTRLIQRILDEIHHADEKTVQGPTKAFAAVVGLAISIATAGTGSALGASVAGTLSTAGTATHAVIAGMTTGVFSSVCTQAGLALLNNEGDIGKAAKSLASSTSLKSIAQSALTAGMTKGVGHAFDIPTSAADTKTLGDHFQRQLLEKSTSLGVNMAFGADFEEALAYSVKSGAADFVGNVLSNHLGDLYGDKKLDAVSHKLLHALSGAVSGAILDNPLSGALGAFMAETFADMFSPHKPTFEPTFEKMRLLEAQKGRPLTPEEFNAFYLEEMKSYKRAVKNTEDFAKLTAATTALLTGNDVDVAIRTGTNALENNFLVFAYYAVVGVGFAYSVYEVYSEFQENGPEAALKKLGIEIVLNVAGGATIKVLGKPVGKTVRAGIEYVMKKNPALKIMLGTWAETFIQAGEKLLETKLGKQAAQLAGAGARLERQALEKAQKLLPGNRFASEASKATRSPVLKRKSGSGGSGSSPKVQTPAKPTTAPTPPSKGTSGPKPEGKLTQKPVDKTPASATPKAKNPPSLNKEFKEYVNNSSRSNPSGRIRPETVKKGKIFEKPAEETSYSGGAYAKLDRIPGKERHHMPADSITSISRAKGPAIQMEAKDHALTSSYGNSQKAQKYRQQIKEHLDRGDFRTAMAHEIKDVRSSSGKKYNKPIKEMLDYAKRNNYLDKKK